jgi:hypothetical protein
MPDLRLRESRCPRLRGLPRLSQLRPRLPDGPIGVIRVEQSPVTGRWYVTENGSRVPQIGHASEPLALAAAGQLREDRCGAAAR